MLFAPRYRLKIISTLISLEKNIGTKSYGKTRNGCLIGFILGSHKHLSVAENIITTIKSVR